MKKYRVNFYRDGQLLITGHGEATDEYEAETKATIMLGCIYTGILRTVERVEVIEE